MYKTGGYLVIIDFLRIKYKSKRGNSRRVIGVSLRFCFEEKKEEKKGGLGGWTDVSRSACCGAVERETNCDGRQRANSDVLYATARHTGEH